MKFADKKDFLNKHKPLPIHGKASREEIEKKVIEGTDLVVKEYRKALIKLGNT